MNFNKIFTKMSFFLLPLLLSGTSEHIERYFKKVLGIVNYYTIVRNKMHTYNNGYNMKMSSKYDQSGTEPSFLPPQGLLSRSSKPRGKRGWVSLPMPHAVSRGSLTFHLKVISRRHFF